MSSGRTVNTKWELIFIEMPTSWEGGQDFHLLCHFWSRWKTRRSMFGHCTPCRCAPVNVAHAKETISISYPTHIPIISDPSPLHHSQVPQMFLHRSFPTTFHSFQHLIPSPEPTVHASLKIRTTLCDASISEISGKAYAFWAIILLPEPVLLGCLVFCISSLIKCLQVCSFLRIFFFWSRKKKKRKKNHNRTAPNYQMWYRIGA